MGTRSIIAIQYEDGSCRAVYCHWNGQPKFNGRWLSDYYRSVDLVNQIMDHGDMSSLGGIIGEKHDFDADFSWLTNAERPCTFYKRDRDATDVDARVFDTDADLNCYLDANNDIEFAYLILVATGGWVCCNLLLHDATTPGAWIALTEAIEKSESGDDYWC